MTVTSNFLLAFPIDFTCGKQARNVRNCNHVTTACCSAGSLGSNYGGGECAATPGALRTSRNSALFSRKSALLLSLNSCWMSRHNPRTNFLSELKQTEMLNASQHVVWETDCAAHSHKNVYHCRVMGSYYVVSLLLRQRNSSVKMLV